jgi:phage terminase small subunit
VGSRGPIRSIDSRRGEREARRARRDQGATPAVVSLQMPPWLPEERRPTWERVTDALRAAAVPLQRVDCDAVGFWVTCLDGAATAAATGDLKALARFERDAVVWSNLLGATPASRARLGLKPKQEKRNPFLALDGGN